MASISKPDYSYIWASGGAVVEPSNTKKQTGWGPEVPPFQWENWIQNRQDQMLAHINQRGIPEWDGQTEYEAGGLSYVQGSDGKIYKSVLASGPSTTTQDPTTDDGTYWEEAFISPNDALTYAEGDARYAQIANNLSDLTNAATARTNLGVYSVSQVDSLIANASNLDTVRIDVASASTVDLTTAAPNTRHINITGTTAITGFTVEAGRCYFVRFADALTLTNSASLVTQTGANITTAAGDTCIIRATAANVVEVLCYTPGIPQEIGYRQTWQDVTASRAVNTTYTNTTGRPIQVIVTAGVVGALNTEKTLTINGISLGAWNHSGSTTLVYSSVTFTVPHNSTYSIGGTGEINKWIELR